MAGSTSSGLGTVIELNTLYHIREEGSRREQQMPISERTLSRWSHHQAGTAFKQAHVPIRNALAAYDWPSEVNYRVFLQGSYKNDTNLGGDSDVDVVVRLASRLRPRVADLSGKALQNDGSHKVALERWE